MSKAMCDNLPCFFCLAWLGLANLASACLVSSAAATQQLQRQHRKARRIAPRLRACAGVVAVVGAAAAGGVIYANIVPAFESLDFCTDASAVVGGAAAAPGAAAA